MWCDRQRDTVEARALFRTMWANYRTLYKFRARAWGGRRRAVLALGIQEALFHLGHAPGCREQACMQRTAALPDGLPLTLCLCFIAHPCATLGSGLGAGTALAAAGECGPSLLEPSGPSNPALTSRAQRPHPHTPAPTHCLVLRANSAGLAKPNMPFLTTPFRFAGAKEVRLEDIPSPSDLADHKKWLSVQERSMGRPVFMCFRPASSPAALPVGLYAPELDQAVAEFANVSHRYVPMTTLSCMWSEDNAHGCLEKRTCPLP